MSSSGIPTRFRIAVWFAIGGGIGIPAIFVSTWQVLVRALSGDALSNAMEWFEAFRVMVWPSAILIVYRAAGDTAAEWLDLLLAVAINVVVYSIIGISATFALKNRIAQVVVVLVIAVGMYAMNMYWSHHLVSFIIAAVLLTVVFWSIFGRVGTTRGYDT